MKEINEILEDLETIKTELEIWNTVNNNVNNIHDWIVDYWFNVEDNINFAILTYLQNNSFDKDDVVDREDLGEFISERIQEGILNVVDSYGEEVQE